MTDLPLIHSFDAATGEHVATRPARANPKRPDEPIVPAIATLIAPPAAGPDEAAVFDRAAGAWSLVPDHRGTEWWEADGTPHRIEALGEAPAAGAVLVAPPGPRHRHDGSGWVVDVAAEAAAIYRAGLVAANAQPARIENLFSQAERNAWPQLASHARGILGGTAAPDGALILRRAERKGRSPEEEAARVLALAEAFEKVTLEAMAVRELAEAAGRAFDQSELDVASGALEEGIAQLTSAVDEGLALLAGG